MGATSTISMLDTALAYARRGWAVFPLHAVHEGRCTCGNAACGSPGKHPRTEHGFKDATTNETTIRQWWTEHPSANIGIATGKPSGLLVVDVDPRHGGDEALHELEAQQGPLPDTVESQTGGGGRHILLSYPGYVVKSGTNALGPGLDVKSGGGYIVAPPSVHPSGRRYEWEASSHPDEVEIAEAPAWMLAMLKTEANGNSPKEPFAVPEKIHDGERNVTLYRLARSLKARGLSYAAILAALRAENVARCTPPLDDSEVEKIARHAHGQADRPEFATNGDGQSEEQAETRQPGTTRKSLSDALVDYKALLAVQLPERPRHLPWLAAGSSAMAYGARGVGKTYFLLGCATALTTGTPLLCWPATDPVGVLYVDGEMQLDELRARATALLSEPPKAPLLFLTSELVYHKTERDLVLTHEDVRAEITAMLNSRPEIKVLIFDNISTLFPGIDEDSKRHWEPVAAWLIKLRHRGLATVLVHHAGKGGQQRGTSGREDSLDTVISLTLPAGYDAQDGCHFELRFTKSRSVKGVAVAPLDVRLLEQDGRLTWAHNTLEESKLDQVKGLLDEGITSPAEIAEALGIDRTWAWRLKKRAEAAK